MTHTGVIIERHFTSAENNNGVELTTRDDVFGAITWELRNAQIGTGDKISFLQEGVEFPSTWSQNSTNIVAQKYFRGQLDSPDRERSVKQMVGRVAQTITRWGRERGYFQTEADGDAFEAELTYILVNQLAAFNSPVWFNVGFEDEPQCSACFILSVADHLIDADGTRIHNSITDWNTREAKIFRGGSGSGINLSNIRGSQEPLAKGGTATGPVSFMRGTDTWAGTIKSGGKTRRAAKMVVLNVDHPDILDFIRCKAEAEDVAQLLLDNGYSMGLDSDAFSKYVPYQNANNSVRVTDEFLAAVENDADWDLVARSWIDPETQQPKIIQTVKARELMDAIAEAAWRCADPGVQYDTTINAAHTCPNSGRINGSNPCSEYMHVDDSACNLASLNLMKFRNPDGSFNVEDYTRAIDIVFMAQEITIGTEAQPASSFPDEVIARNARRFRQLGLGYANLGAFLMSNGMPYDSEEGRATAAAITAIMNARAYYQSALLARDVGPYEEYELNRDPHNAVMRMHRDAAYKIPAEHIRDPALLEATHRVSDEMVAAGEEYGYRNAQATVLAPTGTISFLMDCDTTGVEPDYSLVKYKELVGGGSMTIVNGTVPMALETLGYTPEQVEGIKRYIDEHGTIVGAPGLREEDLPVFDVAVGERAISWRGHVEMMGAVQPFLSGAISKTVNLPASATVGDIKDAYLHAAKIGVKALAVYRDDSKTAQALRTDVQEVAVEAAAEVFAHITARREFLAAWAGAFYQRVCPEYEYTPDERGKIKLPNTRPSFVHAVNIISTDDSGAQVKHKFYFVFGLYPDGTPAEMFAVANKTGSFLRGIIDMMSMAMSDAFKRGQTPDEFIAFYRHHKFDPSGRTNNPDIAIAQSPTDYVAQLVATMYWEDDELEAASINTRAVRRRQAAALDAGEVLLSTPVIEETTVAVRSHSGAVAMLERPIVEAIGNMGKECNQCGGTMQRTGSCYTCPTCGNNTGCG